MNVTIATRLQTRPGEADAVTAVFRAAFATRAIWTRPRRHARLIQALDDPAALLYLAEWESRAAFLARMTMRGVEQRLQQLTTRYERHFVRPIRAESAGQLPDRARIVTCGLVRVPPAQSAGVLTYLVEELGPAVREIPGLIRRTIYEDLDQVDWFLLVYEWDTRAAWEAARRELVPTTEESLRLRGGQLQRFVGQTRLAVGPRPTKHRG